MYAVLNLGYKPAEFANLPQREKAFVIHCINEKVEAERRHAAEMKKQAGKAKSRKGR